MKKILLFLLLITYSFSVDGFGELKRESSPEEFYKYYSHSKHNVYDNSVFTIIDPDVYFEGESFNRVVLTYIKGKLTHWIGSMVISKDNAEKIYTKYKNKYKPKKETFTANGKSFSFSDLESKYENYFQLSLTEYKDYSVLIVSFAHIAE